MAARAEMSTLDVIGLVLLRRDADRQAGRVRLGSLADTSYDLFTASLDLLFGRHEAIDEQAEKSDVHTDEEHHVHGVVAT